MRSLRVACVAALLGVAGAVSWHPCKDSGGLPMTPSGVVLTPDPAVASKPFLVVVPGQTSVSVNDGAISVLVLYTDVPVYETKVPLCATVPCPVSPGPVNVTYSQTLPGVAPPARGQRGAYSIKFSGADGDGDPLFCVELAFKIVPAPHHGLAAAAQELLGALGSRGARKGAADALRAAWRTEQPSGTAAAAVATA